MQTVEEHKRKQKEYYQANKEACKKRVKARYLLKREEIIAQGAVRRRADPVKFQTYRAKWEKKTKTYSMYHNAKRRARELNLPFDLDWREIEIPTHCPILGIELYQEGFRDSSASLDRIDPLKGYVKDNVKVISLKANRIKAEGTADQHRRIADYIEGILKPLLNVSS